MERFPDLALSDLQVFLLVFFRIGGTLMLAPLFGGETVPVRLRVLIAFLFAVLFYPLLPPDSLTPSPNALWYATAIAQELAVGTAIGFAAMLLFVGAQFAGQLVDQELGLSMANVIDPVSNEQVSVMSQFKVMLGMIVWIQFSGHHSIVRGLGQSFSVVPLLGFSISSEAGVLVSERMIQDLFISGIRLAAPAVATLFVVTIGMAFLSRILPEMNIFTLGFSLRILIGLGVLILTVGYFCDAFLKQSVEHEHRVQELIHEIGRPGS